MTDYDPGVYNDIDINVYHASGGISNSGLGDVLQSPYHYYSRHLDPTRPFREPSLPQEDGNITHCAILEPDEFHHRYVVGPDVRRNTNAWKEFCSIHEGKTVIKPDQYTRAMRQRDEVWKLSEIASLLVRGKPEVSAYWKDDHTGVLCRCRPDFVSDVSDSSVVLVDVKTYSDARPSEFERQCARMNYHRQNAFYSDGYELASNKTVDAFIFLSVEMPWPHAAAASMLDKDSINSGRYQYRRALKKYAQALHNDLWPGYPDHVKGMRIPPYAMEGPL